MNKEEVIEAVKVCILGDDCDNCQLHDKVACQQELLGETLKLLKENEPAPSANGTSSNHKNITTLDDTAKLEICQEKIADIKEDLLLIYEDMTNEEQRAWELGEIFNQMTNLLKSGDTNA